MTTLAAQANHPAPCPACNGERWELFTTSFDRMLNRPEKTWDVQRCRQCGLGRTEPPLALEEIKQHYPEGYLGDTQKTVEEFLAGRLQRSRSWRNETDKVALVEKYVSGGSILDVGCADGKFLWALDSKRWKRTGVDFSEQTIRTVKTGIPDLTLIEGDVFAPELQEHAFDVVTLWHVFEHLPQAGKALARVRKLLRPGGWIFISVPNFDSFQARIFQEFWYSFDVPRHLFHYSPVVLEILLKQHQMRVHEHVFFSRTVNIHSLKYSAIYWSEGRFGTRLPYYLLKPLLMLFPLLESWSGKYGTLTTVGRFL